jgi:hypothetical protein
MQKQDIMKMIVSDHQHIIKQGDESKFKYNIKRLRYFLYLTLLKTLKPLFSYFEK